ncbi:MAG: hypothetical protein LUQ65_11700 [Candidatus Helarchaeota archaeon]|nr:hypothetical protein [Candidatus Helarchaeota archaeon]
MSSVPSTKKISKKSGAPLDTPKITSPEQEYVLTQIWHSLGKSDYTIQDIQKEPGNKMRVVRSLLRKGLIDIVGPQEKLNLTIPGLHALKYDKWMHKYSPEELERKWQDLMKYRTETKEAIAEMESIYHWQWQCALKNNDQNLAEFFQKKWLETQEKLAKITHFATDKKYKES